jgi:putative modified peptide
MEMKKMAAPPLGAQVVDRLLDLLSTDDTFRALFVSDTYAALLQAGYTPPEGANENTVNPALCLYTPKLASKGKIARERGKLTRTLNGVVNYACPTELQED